MSAARGILLDVEGTTTRIAFVYDVLFPYARAHLGEYFEEADASELEREHADDVRHGNDPPPWSAGPAVYAEWLMDRDRKSTALKDAQGKIWLCGYEAGELRGEVFPDVPPALERWHRGGVDVCIFSSGSVLAQRLLFRSTPEGDLTRFIKGHFDTTSGPKDDAESYARIAGAYGMASSRILFVSDTLRELDAARSAGMQTRLCIRPGNPPQPGSDHEPIATFDHLP